MDFRESERVETSDVATMELAKNDAPAASEAKGESKNDSAPDSTPAAKLNDGTPLRYGLGIAVHSGDNRDFEDPFDDDVEFGTSVLFAPEAQYTRDLLEAIPHPPV